MPENKPSSKKSFSPDWLVQGILTRIGDTFDRLLGRGWKPSSSLATSELIEKLKKLLDAEARESPDKRRFVPHNIQLKMQWEKFSTDAGESLKKLESELLTATVDHINDKLYYTYAPLVIEVKTDYFTSGVKLFVSFDKFSEVEHEAEMNVTMLGMKSSELLAGVDNESTPYSETVIASFQLDGQSKLIRLRFEGGQRLSVGRTKENQLTIDDPSVSKIHASLMLSAESRIIVADTGSTNGTFIDGERIPYGKAIEIESGKQLKFGTVEVGFEFMPKPVQIHEPPELPKTGTFRVGEFEFSKPIEIEKPELTETEVTIPKPVISADLTETIPTSSSQSVESDFSDDITQT